MEIQFDSAERDAPARLIKFSPVGRFALDFTGPEHRSSSRPILINFHRINADARRVARTNAKGNRCGSWRALRNRERFRHRERDASCIYWHAAINGAHGVCRTTAFYAAILRGMFMNEGIDTRFARHAS